jgi:nicotinamidase-related amidase
MNIYTTPDFENSALITIDTQRDTLDGQPLEIKGTSQALPNIRRLLDCYREKKLPIVHIVRIYKEDGSNADLCRKDVIEGGVKLLAQGSIGAELALELFGDDSVKYDSDALLRGAIQKISENEVIIYKPRWGAFYDTPLHSHLQGLGVDTLVFSGCNFPNCPRTSIYEASERDYKIALAKDAISGLYERGIEELTKIGVLVENTDLILDKINA